VARAGRRIAVAVGAMFLVFLAGFVVFASGVAKSTPAFEVFYCCKCFCGARRDGNKTQAGQQKEEKLPYK